MKKCLSFIFFLLAGLHVLTACNSAKDDPKTNLGVSMDSSVFLEESIEENSSKTDLILSEDKTVYEIATPYLSAFQEMFPNAQVTKVRWQYVPELDATTMIIEGTSVGFSTMALRTTITLNDGDVLVLNQDGRYIIQSATLPLPPPHGRPPRTPTILILR